MLMYNPWHGCHKISKGCRNCYMYFLDREHGIETPSDQVVKNKSGFLLPIEKRRDGSFRIQPGGKLNLCRTSDFFVEDADPWRKRVWSMIKYRSDLIWDILTKRPERFADCLPDDWGDGYENVLLGVTAENQEAADRRINCAPFIGPVVLPENLQGIDHVGCGGENYDGCRVCREEWVRSLSDQCRNLGITFCFYETGTCYEKDGTIYTIKSKAVQSAQAYLSGLSHMAAPRRPFLLKTTEGVPMQPDTPVFYGRNCDTCGNRPVCQGCRSCGKCKS